MVVDELGEKLYLMKMKNRIKTFKKPLKINNHKNKKTK